MVTSYRPVACAGPVAQAWRRAVARASVRALACIAGLVAHAPASARDYAARDVGDWTVAASKDGKGCFLTRDYDRTGGTSLFLGLDVDGTNRLSVLNANWSIRPEDRLKLNFRLSNSSYPAHFAIGIVSEGKQGFVTSFGAKFPSYFAASKTLDISRGDVPVERLSLDGGDAALPQLLKCVDDQRAKPPMAGKAGAPGDAGDMPDHIPKDPFAPSPHRKSEK